MAEKVIILFESADKSVSLSVPFESETVWLNRQQMASLFDRDVKTIGKHVNNAIEEELEGLPTVANDRRLAELRQTLQNPSRKKKNLW